GDEVTIIASRTIAPDDPVGQWRSFSTYHDAAGASHDADTSITFTVTAPQSRVAPAPSRPATARPLSAMPAGPSTGEARAPRPPLSLPPALPPATEARMVPRDALGALGRGSGGS